MLHETCLPSHDCAGLRGSLIVADCYTKQDDLQIVE